ncbi:MAG TPA: heavy metal translocating P-type ATPase [Thermomicrobiales bacterium]|nr:heavy metal translocating P-type ATPase [Thermomicrobiales bacterium]
MATAAHTLSSPQPELTTGRAGSEPPDASFGAWARHWRLAILATFSWLFTVAGMALDHLTDAPPAVYVPIFILAYLAGGTIATKDAIADLLDRSVNVDLLMVLAALGAASLGAWAEGAILLSLFSTSNALEYHALDRTRNAVRALMDLSPQQARVVRDGEMTLIPVEELAVDDVVIIHPGEKIPADGQVITGASAVDQAAITGESIPVEKVAGDEIFAGTLNGNGALEARVTKLSTESTLARIVKLVESAREQKSNLERFADAFEGRYAAFVIAFSILVWIVPMLFGVSFDDAFYRAMTLLVVMSPCALVISTPAATLSALANAARRGVLVKGGRSLEMLGSVDTVAFDKTGTLTVGRPRLTDLVMVDGTPQDAMLARIAAAEQLSEHPIARAMVGAAQERGLALPEADHLEAHVGMGITANVDGQLVAVGNDRLFAQFGVEVPAHILDTANALRQQGKTSMLAGDARGVHAIVAVEDTLRPEAMATITALKKAGIKRTVMLSGDSERVARAIAARLGIDDVRADLMPDEKVAAIQELKRHGKVAMVGDGVNDAPALATADVGIAMGAAGSDVALETADIVLMSDDLAKLPGAIDLSHAMKRTIRVNLAFSLSVIAILATANLVQGIPLPLGVVGHEGSTIIVVLNGLRLLAHGRSFGKQETPKRPKPATVSPDLRTT